MKKMRVLVANIPLPSNRFLVDLNQSLQRHVQLTHDHEIFWEMSGEFDIVHLHFPEYMTYEIESAYRESLSDTLISEIERRLEYWSNRCAIVITRHVLLPHDALEDPRWEKLYETVYRFVDGVVHFANPSIEEFQERYSHTNFVYGHPIHSVIPHHNYASLPNEMTREQARSSLGIPTEANVLLVFGAIRNNEERDLIITAFRESDVRKKILLVSRWRETLPRVSWIRLKYWVRDLVRLYNKIHPRYFFNYGFVQEEDAQIYLNAADVLFIPRLHVLNSGNVTLGMTFGKVVVGPDSLDVGYLLRETGNVVFDPDRPQGAGDAITEAFRLAENGKVASSNRKRALGEWAVDRCADQYVQFFGSIIKRRNTE